MGEFPVLPEFSFVGNDWAKVLAILNCALHSAINIPENFLRLRIIVAHFARTVSAHVIQFAANIREVCSLTFFNSGQT
jgi:hypothetical protein